MIMVRQFKREYELKKEQVKQVLATLKDMDSGKEINLEQSVGLKD